MRLFTLLALFALTVTPAFAQTTPTPAAEPIHIMRMELRFQQVPTTGPLPRTAKSSVASLVAVTDNSDWDKTVDLPDDTPISAHYRVQYSNAAGVTVSLTLHYGKPGALSTFVVSRHTVQNVLTDFGTFEYKGTTVSVDITLTDVTSRADIITNRPRGFVPAPSIKDGWKIILLDTMRAYS